MARYRGEVVNRFQQLKKDLGEMEAPERISWAALIMAVILFALYLGGVLLFMLWYSWHGWSIPVVAAFVVGTIGITVWSRPRGET